MGYEGGVRTREGKQTKRSRAGSVFFLLVEMALIAPFRLVKGSAEGWRSQKQMGRGRWYGFRPETADFGGQM